MALSSLCFCQWNHSAPPIASHWYMRLGVGLGIERYCCHSTPGESQPWTFFWQLWEVTSGHFAHALSQIRHQSLVASPSHFPHRLNFMRPFIQNHLHPLPTNPFSLIEIIQQQPALKCLQKIWNCYVPVQLSIFELFQMVLPVDNGTDAFPWETQPSILSSTCCKQHSQPAPSFWQIASRRIWFASPWLAVYHLHHPSPMTYRSHHLHYNRHRNPPAMGASPQSLQHLFSAVPQGQESFRWEANGTTPRCTGRRSRWRSRPGRCWPIDWIVSRRSWRHCQCTWRWRPLSWWQLLGQHLRLAITTLVEVISLRLWPITWKSVACAGVWLWTVVCHVEWRLEIKLWSAWKWLLWRRVSIPMKRMLFIGVLPRLTVLASDSSWTIIWGCWIVVKPRLRANQATLWRHIHCLPLRFLRGHVL